MGAKENTASKFIILIETTTEGHKTKISTPIRQEVKMFEQMGRDPGQKSLSKLKRLRDKPGPGIQMSINKFLLKKESEERTDDVTRSESQTKTIERGTQSPGNQRIKPSRPLRALGAKKKPRLATPSGPAEGSPLEGRGKTSGGLRKESKGTSRPLDQWLLKLGKKTRGPRGRDTGVVEGIGSLETPGGNKGGER